MSTIERAFATRKYRELYALDGEWRAFVASARGRRFAPVVVARLNSDSDGLAAFVARERLSVARHSAAYTSELARWRGRLAAWRSWARARGWDTAGGVCGWVPGECVPASELVALRARVDAMRQAIADIANPLRWDTGQIGQWSMWYSDQGATQGSARNDVLPREAQANPVPWLPAWEGMHVGFANWADAIAETLFTRMTRVFTSDHDVMAFRHFANDYNQWLAAYFADGGKPIVADGVEGAGKPYDADKVINRPGIAEQFAKGAERVMTKIGIALVVVLGVAFVATRPSGGA